MSDLTPFLRVYGGVHTLLFQALKRSRAKYTLYLMLFMRLSDPHEAPQLSSLHNQIFKSTERRNLTKRMSLFEVVCDV